MRSLFAPVVVALSGLMTLSCSATSSSSESKPTKQAAPRTTKVDKSMLPPWKMPTGGHVQRERAFKGDKKHTFNLGHVQGFGFRFWCPSDAQPIGSVGGYDEYLYLFISPYTGSKEDFRFGDRLLENSAMPVGTGFKRTERTPLMKLASHHPTGLIVKAPHKDCFGQIRPVSGVPEDELLKFDSPRSRPNF